mgnify:CR=1 FL=1
MTQNSTPPYIEIEKRIDYSMMHDAVGYTPYEGHVYKGWPQTVLSRGRIVIENNQLRVERGSGKYLARGVPGPIATARTIDAAKTPMMSHSRMR